MELTEVVRLFGEMCALTPEEAEQHRSLCASSMARVEAERGFEEGGEEALAAYAAAMACRRFVLRCIACGGTVAIGDPKSGPAGARSAAEALEADYRAAAGRWLRPGSFCFWQLPRPEGAPEETPPAGSGSGEAPPEAAG